MEPLSPRLLSRRFLRASPILVGLLLVLPIRSAAEEPTDPVTLLRAEIEALRADYETRISELEARLAELEAERAAVEEEKELAALKAAATAAAVAEPEPSDSTPQRAEAGRERNLNRYNPEISFTGDLFASASDLEEDGFELGELELNLQASLDPFSFTKATVAVGEDGAAVEELYVGYSGLLPGLQLTAGKFRQSFGVLNRWHSHALPQTGYPLALVAYLGEEGLAQTGLGARWLLPKGWATTNELTFEVTDAQNEALFGGEAFEDLSLLGRLTSYWDLSPATYLEWGLSGVAGGQAGGGTSRLWGTDITLRWQPPNRAKYRGVTWRTEAFLSQRDDEIGERQDAWGGYSYLEALVAQNLTTSLRLDLVEDPLEPDRHSWGIFPNLSWWQSEYVRLRAEYGFLDHPEGLHENRFTLQLTWAAGPHKHEAY